MKQHHAETIYFLVERKTFYEPNKIEKSRVKSLCISKLFREAQHQLDERK